jgi:hypothetical protein
MSPRTSTILLTAGLLFATTPAFAQNLQNWETNQQTQIQQDASSGLLNSGQAQYLQNRETQIQAQQQAYLKANGGTLTGGETRQIQHELSSVNHQLGRDVARNTGGRQAYYPANYTLGNYAPYQWRNYNGYYQQAQPQYTGNWGYKHHWVNNGWH